MKNRFLKYAVASACLALLVSGQVVRPPGHGGAGATVSDAVYGPAWDGVSGAAPSKNAVYDKIEALSLSGAPEGTTVNSGTPAAGSLAIHADTTGTNLQPSSVTATGTNIIVPGELTAHSANVTNGLTADIQYVGSIVATNAIGVASGGTGRATITEGALLKGNGTNAVEDAVAGTDYLAPGSINTVPFDGTWEDDDDTFPSSGVLYTKLTAMDASIAAAGVDTTYYLQTTDATAAAIYTNTLAEGASGAFRADVTGSGSTNYAFSFAAQIHNLTGTAAITGTNEIYRIPSGGTTYGAYWSVTGADARLMVAGDSGDVNWGATVRALVVTNAAAASSFTANTAVFDGSNDYMTPGTQTGWADGRSFTISFWIKFNGGDGAQQTIVYSGPNTTQARFMIERTAANTIRWYGVSGGGTTQWDYSSTATITADAAWHHVLIAVNNSTPSHAIWIDGTQDTEVPTTQANTANADLSGSVFRFASFGDGTLLLNASLAELWMDDVENAVIADYWTAGGPISLGSTGELPTGSAPAFYYSLVGSGNSWADDSSGNANNSTVTGALTTDTAP